MTIREINSILKYNKENQYIQAYLHWVYHQKEKALSTPPQLTIHPSSQLLLLHFLVTPPLKLPKKKIRIIYCNKIHCLESWKKRQKQRKKTKPECPTEKISQQQSKKAETHLEKSSSMEKTTKKSHHRSKIIKPQKVKKHSCKERREKKWVKNTQNPLKIHSFSLKEKNLSNTLLFTQTKPKKKTFLKL